MWSYTYDAANQMTRERQRQYTSGSVVGTTFDQQYSFDEAGNRLTRTGSGTGYEAFDATGGSGYNDLNQLVDYTIDGGDPITHTYDNGGRLTDKYDGSRIDWDYYWNADGTMARVQNNDDGTYIKYTYDWKGRRLEREDETASSNGPKRRYYFVGLTPVAERVGSYIGSYSWSNDVFNTLTGGDLGQVLWRRTGGSTDNSLHYDHIGNVLAEANTSGVVTLANEQDAYGRPILSSAAGWGDNSLHQTTKPWDDSAELFYFNARWYDNALDSHLTTSPGRSSGSPFGDRSRPCPGYVCNESNVPVVIAKGTDQRNVWTGAPLGFHYVTLPPNCCTGAEDWDFVYTPPRGWFKIPNCTTGFIRGTENSKTMYWVDLYIPFPVTLIQRGYGYNHGNRPGPQGDPPYRPRDYEGCRPKM